MRAHRLHIGGETCKKSDLDYSIISNFLGNVPWIIGLKSYLWNVDASYLSSSVQINAGAGFTYILEEGQSLDELAPLVFIVIHD